MRTNKNLLQKGCKNVIKKFVSITVLLKEAMILLKGNKMYFYRIKLLKLIHIYIIIYLKKNLFPRVVPPLVVV